MDSAPCVPVTKAAVQRLQRDLKQLHREPVVGAGAGPAGDDLSRWDGVVFVPLTVQGTSCTAPLHFRIDFPTRYPHEAPSVSFSTVFPYHLGSSYLQDSGRLAGCKVLCLDLLGNFAAVHTEWAEAGRSGWSPAYTVTTLLVNLQSVFAGLGPSMSEQARVDLLRRCLDFADANPNSIPPAFTAADYRALAVQRDLQERLAPALGAQCQVVVAAAVDVVRAILGEVRPRPVGIGREVGDAVANAVAFAQGEGCSQG